MSEILLKNPLTLWLRWVLVWCRLQWKYRGKHLNLEYLCEVTSSQFSEYNTIRKYARVRDSSFGSYSYVSRNSQVYHATVGKFTCIGPEVIIGPGEHPTNMVSSHPIFYSTMGQSNPVIVAENLFDEFPRTHIGNDVWIGARAIIRTGITIGDGAIIAAGAVVVQNVEPYSIVGGVPAAPIRYRFSSDEIAAIRETRWWDKDLQWIEKHKDAFTNIQAFMQVKP